MDPLSKRYHTRTLLTLLGVFSTSALLAQSDSGKSVMDYSLLIIGALVVLAAIILLSENLLKVEAKRNNTEVGDQDSPGRRGFLAMFSPKPPDYVEGGAYFPLKRGFNIRIEGEPDKVITEAEVNTFAMQPPNFRGIAPIPKVVVNEGDEVLAGDKIFFNKKTPDIYYAAPVSGEVAAIKRGAKRAITQIVILADKEVRYRELPLYQGNSREELAAYLRDVGFWPMIRQRPYDIVPDANKEPRDIFISTFDTAPLAADQNLIVSGREEYFQAGLDTLNMLTSGHVYLGLGANGKEPPSTAFRNAKGVRKNWFRGKHPAGNVGVQIHHIHPIRRGEAVWTLRVQDVILLGRIMLDRQFNTERLVSLSGGPFADPGYVRTHLGANIGDLISGRLAGTEEEIRLISGDVLSGEKKDEEQFLNCRDNQVSAIMEGNYFELFGWLVPSKMRPTISHSFPNFMFPGTKLPADTNTHGEKRAFVMTGEYESVLPMDIYPQHLMKAIMVSDFERMEGLGIYELTEEDIALCEFACTSKMPLQQILREGIELMREQE